MKLTNGKSCPFCGTNHSLEHGESYGFNRVECIECGATGPVADSEDAAETLWQERVSEAESQYTQTFQ